MQRVRQQVWQIVATGIGLLESLAGIGSIEAAVARPIPDDTLGTERSQVVDRSGVDFDIDGGARRGSNLFHSFQDFGVVENGSVYFLNPIGVENILSRVTGNSPSNILGRLGVRGSANLFLMNPNGIVFGGEASLDVQGAFVGTTANALQFGEQGFFSATNPEAPALLTVNPSAFLFNQLPVGSIINNSIAPAGVNAFGAAQSGLRVDGDSLLLVGGDISMDGGRLNALSGRIELVGLSGVGRIDLTTAGNRLRLHVPANSPLSNISLTNNAFVNTSGTVGGEIIVHSRELNLINGGQFTTATAGAGDGGDVVINTGQMNLLGTGTPGADGVIPASGIFSLTVASGNAGDIIINANQIRLEAGGQLFASSSGLGNAGNITITANAIDLVGSLANSPVRTAIASEAYNTGSAGNIEISTNRLNLLDGSGISSSTFSAGRAGNLTIRALDSVNLSGVGINSGRSIGSTLTTASTGAGAAGAIIVNTGRLNLQSGGTISASTAQMGQGGLIRINADTIDIAGAIVNGQVQISAIANISTLAGNGGAIEISTRRLSMQNGGQMTTRTSGQGRGGDLTINATESVDLRGSLFANGRFSIALLETGTTGSGDAGSLAVNTRRLSIQEGARISASALASGRAGDITINADSINLIGIPRSFNQTGIDSETSGSSNAGRGGDITLNVNRLSVADSALISTGSSSAGQGGDLVIHADRIDLSDRGGLSSGSLITGDAGSLTLNADRLTLRQGGRITASTAGAGQGGAITIVADTIELIGISSDRQQASVIDSTTTGQRATGRGGNIIVSTNRLNIREGGVISTSTSSQGSGGNIRVTAQTGITIEGTETFINGQLSPSGLSTATSSSGRAGNIHLETSRLRLLNGGTLAASTLGSGQGGDILIEAERITLIGQSNNQTAPSIRSDVGVRDATGNAGSITILGEQLHLQDQAFIVTGTSGQGSGGDIWLRLSEGVFLTNASAITSSVFAGSTGDSGNIDILTRSLTALGGAQVIAAVGRPGRDQQGQILSGGRGEGGNIRVVATDFITLSGTQPTGFSSGLLTLSERAADGSAGDITIRTGNFQIANGAIVTASTFNSGSAGDITITTDRLEALNGGQIVTSTRDRGQAGSIMLNADQVILSGTDQNFQNRRERARRYANQPGQTDLLSDVIVNQGAASGIFANTEQNSSGNGGQIAVNSGNLSLANRAAISTRSQGTGTAGNITVNTEILDAIDGNIATSANRASGGTITINGDIIRLRSDSDIRTDSAVNGGNITINADLLIANNDSDVIAAAGERGGDVLFGDTVAFLESYNSETSNADADTLQGNSRADVNATGATPGTISLVDTTFVQNSLTDLPDRDIDPDRLIANSCIARTESGDTFLITGSGGLPPRPGVAPLSPYPIGEVRTEAVGLSWQPGDSIVEPQGVYQLSDGQLVMSRECD